MFSNSYTKPKSIFWLKMLIVGAVFMTVQFCYADDPALSVVELTKTQVSGPCLDDPENHCEAGFFDDGFVFTGVGKNPPATNLAGFEEAGGFWNCPGVNATASLTLNEGFALSWEGLFLGPPNRPSCDLKDIYTVPWYAVLACDDTIIVQTESEYSDLDGAGTVEKNDSLAENMSWIEAAKNCGGDLLVLIIADQSLLVWSGYSTVVYDDQNFANTLETALPYPSLFDFLIEASPDAAGEYTVFDTFPAEWWVVDVDNDDAEGDLPLGCGEETFGTDWLLYKGGKVGKDCQSSTHLEWIPLNSAGQDAAIKFDVATRPSPSNGKGQKEDKFAPTSCGPLYMNNGAHSSTGDYSNDLCLAAVEDMDGTEGIVGDGTGDEDEDGLWDYEEACGIGTDPCDDDTDNDGVIDGLDDCPFEGSPDANIGELQDPNGCNRQSQCSDGLDNEPDGVTDFIGGDPSCDNIIDDSEDNADEDSDGVLDGADQCPLEGDAGDSVDTNGCPNVLCTLTQYFGTSPDPIYWEMVIGPTTNDVSGGVWGRSIPEAGAWPVIGNYDGAQLDITGTNPTGDPILCGVSGNQAEQLNDAGNCDGAGVCTGTYTRICTAGNTLSALIASFDGGACTLN